MNRTELGEQVASRLEQKNRAVPWMAAAMVVFLIVSLIDWPTIVIIS